ncbi:MAG: NAD-dependent epimerase/dehydratase family protein [Candidatus Rokuibacteriota bacterium]
MKVVVTGGAGYVGSLLTGMLLHRGAGVTVVDDLWFGGESLLGHWHHPGFRFVKGDLADPAVFTTHLCAGADAIVHLAAVVGFPACQAAGREMAWQYNVQTTRRMFEAADAAGVRRFVFASTYSNYGLSPNGEPVTEDSPLHPQSLYAETKIAAERYLLNRTKWAVCAPVLCRFATLFGISPRTRFDLLVNQFVLEAVTRRRLVIYQPVQTRAFVHVRDVCEAICLALEAPLATVRGQVFNVGSDASNYTKDEIAELVRHHVGGTYVEYRDLTVDGDMRDIRVSFAKIQRVLGFKAQLSVEDGIGEVRDALRRGLISAPRGRRYRNARAVVR